MDGKQLCCVPLVVTFFLHSVLVTGLKATWCHSFLNTMAHFKAVYHIVPCWEQTHLNY